LTNPSLSIILILDSRSGGVGFHYVVPVQPWNAGEREQIMRTLLYKTDGCNKFLLLAVCVIQNHPTREIPRKPTTKPSKVRVTHEIETRRRKR
jgi:hypothetical protein